MAKYQITYKCGCTSTIQLFGKIADRHKRLEYLATIKCPECYQAECYEAAKAKSSGLPELNGTEKQVRWATQIRASLLDDMHKHEAQIDTMPRTDEDKAKMHEIFSNFYDVILSHTDSAFWIDNRYYFDFPDLKSAVGYIAKTLSNSNH